MEYDTVKQKEKKISVKICKGSIWEELKENFMNKKCLEDKKNDRRKLIVDVNVKREFRSTLKDDSWVNRIKSALTRGRFLDQSDKKDTVAKQQKKEAQKVKQSEKDKNGKDVHKNEQEPEKILESDLIKEESQNILSQTKKRLNVTKDNEQSTSGLLKNKKYAKEIEPKEKNRNKDNLKNSLAGGDLIREVDKSSYDYDLKSSRQKGNKYEVQINNNVVVLKPEDLTECEEKIKKRQITKDKRSKSKPATAKEKWSEFSQGNDLDVTNEPTLETITDLKSSIISLRAVDKKLKNKDTADKPKESKTRRNEDKKKRRKDEERQCSSNEVSFTDVTKLQSKDNKTDLKDERKKQKLIKEILNENKSTDHRRRREKRIKTESSQSSSEAISSQRSSSTVKIKSVLSPNDPIKNSEIHEGNVTDNAAHLMNDIILEDGVPIYSSSSYTGSSSSEEHECSCGCMDSTVQMCSKSNSSESSLSSLEYLRSYSGNLIMCAHGKKPVLNEHIRYLSSCIKL